MKFFYVNWEIIFYLIFCKENDVIWENVILEFFIIEFIGKIFVYVLVDYFYEIIF